MANQSNNQHNQPTDDEIKHVEFLYSDLKDFRDIQDKHYKDLITKNTFLCGFIVTILTLYGTYATQVNNVLRIITLSTLGIALVVLSGAFSNRKFKQAEMSDIDVDSSNYFNKVYQAVANQKRACDENEEPLKAMAGFIRWGVRIFILGVLILALSFCIPKGNVIKSNHDKNVHATSNGKTSKGTGKKPVGHD